MLSPYSFLTVPGPSPIRHHRLMKIMYPMISIQTTNMNNAIPTKSVDFPNSVIIPDIATAPNMERSTASPIFANMLLDRMVEGRF